MHSMHTSGLDEIPLPVLEFLDPNIPTGIAPGGDVTLLSSAFSWPFTLALEFGNGMGIALLAGTGGEPTDAFPDYMLSNMAGGGENRNALPWLCAGDVRR
jgi:hypothetical protein